MDFFIFHHHKDTCLMLVVVKRSAPISRPLTIILKIKLMIKPERLNTIKSKGIEKVEI